MLVVDPKTQRLRIRVRDFVGYLGLTTITVGYIEVLSPNFAESCVYLVLRVSPLTLSIAVQITFLESL